MYVRPGHKSGCIVRRGGPFPSSFRSLSTRPPSHSLSLCLADTPYVCVSFFVSTVRSLTRSLSVRLFTARPASHERRPNLIREGLLNGIQRKPKLLSCVSLDFLSLSFPLSSQFSFSPLLQFPVRRLWFPPRGQGARVTVTDFPNYG